MVRTQLIKRPSSRFCSLRALDSDREVIEAVCRQHWPKEGIIPTTARRESALACAIVVLRALLGTVPPDRRAPAFSVHGNHPLLEAACVLDAEESMRLADIATQPETHQSDFLAIMESLSFLERSFWSIPLEGELFYVEPQPFGPVSRAQARDIQIANWQLERLYAAKGMLIIEPTNDGDDPATLHDAVQQAYNKVLADAPPQASTGCWAAPQFIRLQYDGRMGFEKLCFTLDVAKKYDTEDGQVLSCPPRKWFYECIAAVCLTSELHTVTLWDRMSRVQVEPPSQSPWWVGENDNASLVGDGKYMLYFRRYKEHGPHVVIHPPTTISKHLAPLADDHHPANSPDAELVRFLTRGGLQDRLFDAVEAAEHEDIWELSRALEAIQDEIQYTQDILKVQQTRRALAAERELVADSPADELAGQLSDASSETASWESYSSTREREYAAQPSDVWAASWPTKKWDEVAGQFRDVSTGIAPSEDKSPTQEQDEVAGQLSDASTETSGYLSDASTESDGQHSVASIEIGRSEAKPLSKEQDEVAGQLRDASTEISGHLSDASTEISGQLSDASTEISGQLSIASTEIARSEDCLFTNEREQMLARQLRDANREIAGWRTRVKHLEQQLSTEQLIRNGTVDALIKTHGDTVRNLTKSIEDTFLSTYKAKEDSEDLDKGFDNHVRGDSPFQPADSPPAKRPANDYFSGFDEARISPTPAKRPRVAEPASLPHQLRSAFGDAVRIL